MTETAKPPLFNWQTRELLFSRRVLVLDGVLDDDNGTLLMTQLMSLATADAKAPIALWIHSPGGSVPSMLGIRDIMKLLPCPVSTVDLGIAYSAGQFLLSAGTKGHRYALPHARVLLHQGSSGIGGSAVEVELQADDLRHTVDTVVSLVAADTGQDFQRVYEDSLHDRWFTARQALDYGFIDHIVDSFDQLMPPRRHRAGISIPAGSGQPAGPSPKEDGR